MSLNPKGFAIINLPPLEQRVVDEFETLPLDQYCGGNFRYRRCSQYKMYYLRDSWYLELLPHRPFLQSKAYNPLVGGVPRHFEALRIDPTEQIDAGAKAVPLDTKQIYQINVHQVRTITTPEIVGIVVPEGPHRDGHEVGMIVVFHRSNISGGVTQLLPNGGGKPFFETIIEENQAIVYEDRAMFHNTTDILPLDTKGGYRDTWIVAFNRWEHRRYGEDFERRAAAN